MGGGGDESFFVLLLLASEGRLSNEENVWSSWTTFKVDCFALVEFLTANNKQNRLYQQIFVRNASLVNYCWLVMICLARDGTDYFTFFFLFTREEVVSVPIAASAK